MLVCLHGKGLQIVLDTRTCALRLVMSMPALGMGGHDPAERLGTPAILPRPEQPMSLFSIRQ